MNVARGPKRFFYAGILFLMAMLAVATIALADGGGSYSLLIEKRLAADSPPEAQEQTYSFKIEGASTGGVPIKALSAAYYVVDEDGEKSGDTITLDAGKDKIVTIQGSKTVKIWFGEKTEAGG